MADKTDKHPSALFNLTRYFSIASACAISLVTLVLTTAFYFNSKHEFVQTQEKKNIFLTKTIGNSFWPQFAEYVMRAPEFDSKTLKTRYETTEIHEFIKITVQGLPILKIKWG